MTPIPTLIEAEKFFKELDTVSEPLGQWARNAFNGGLSLYGVQQEIRRATGIIEMSEAEKMRRDMGRWPR